MSSSSLDGIVLGSWGGRTESAAMIAGRISSSFATLVAIGEPLGGPWRQKDGSLLEVADTGRVLDVLEKSPTADDNGDPVPDEYTFRLRVGDWSRRAGQSDEIGRFQAFLGPNSINTVSLSAEGDNIANEVRVNAATIVRAFARSWQPDYFVFTDAGLQHLNSESRLRRGLPSWGYVSWLSDSISRGLKQVDGASTVRFGSGTFVLTDTSEPEQAAGVWRDLLDTRRLRRLPEKQDRLPVFDSQA